MKDTDFSGLRIRCGLDVHLAQWNVSIYIEDKFHKVFQQAPQGSSLEQYLKAQFPNGIYESAYEAGYMGFSVHRDLESRGISNLVVNAADIPSSDKDRRRKRDRRDAKRIGKSLVNKDLKGIFVPSKQQEADRSLVRYRTKELSRQLRRCKQQIKAFLARQGIDYTKLPGGKGWSKDFIKAIKSLEFGTTMDGLMRDNLLAHYEYLHQRHLQIGRQIVELSRSPAYHDLISRLRTIPGIGLLTAMVLVTELMEMERFEDLDHLCAFVGLVPDTSSSDEKERVKGITRRANKELRRILMQAAWVASSKDPVLAAAYLRLKKRMVGQKAIVRIARKLLARVRYVWKSGNKYELIPPAKK